MPISTTSAVARAAPPVSGGVPKRDFSMATSGVAGRYRPAAGHQRAATGGTSTGQRRPGATLPPSDGNDMENAPPASGSMVGGAAARDSPSTRTTSPSPAYDGV